MFTHLLITRFNIKVSGLGPEGLDSSSVNEHWFEERMKLFEMICAPSVLGQTNTNFTWLIYVDPTTDLERFTLLKDSPIAIELIFAEDFLAMKRDIISRIRAVSSPYVITSRMDNDDVVSSIYIQTIQDAFQQKDKLIINLNSGFDYHSQVHLLTKWNKRFRNGFMSLIEAQNAASIYSVYGFPHWKPPVDFAIHNCDGPPYWIYWRHGVNYSNQETKGIPVFIKPDMSAFPTAVRAITISFKNTTRYLLEWMPRVIKRRMIRWIRQSENES
ncbi:MAG: glycosyltransferase [Saprospiraceae bacterium]|nr:glycosyltransferase [Saprospiraceae bacterium]